MRNIALKIAYDGTRYHGWQQQKDLPTVSQTLEEAIEKAFDVKGIRLLGCGRTDQGVHAERYVANFRAALTVPEEKLPLAVNARLPGDISVLAAKDVESGFNSILSCLRKEYTYRIYVSRVPNPFLSSRALFYRHTLRLDRMKEAAAAFIGRHDFAAVRSAGSRVTTTVREVYSFNVIEKGGLIELSVCANGFLYNMARAMAGTLIYASEGKIDPKEIPLLLQKADRRLTGPTVPPHGLYMTGVWYPDEYGLGFSGHEGGATLGR